MKINQFLLPACVAVLLSSCAAPESHIGEKVFSNDDLSITQLEENMWVVETTDMTTMYIVEGNKKALLIDTGTDCKDLDKVVREITSKPLEVVLTHFHPDHAGTIRYFDEIYMHPADTVLLGQFDNVGEYKGTIHYVDNGYVFDLGGDTRLEVKHMPGHTPGSIVLLDWKTGNCYSGDAFGSGQVWLQVKPVSPMSTYLKSVKAMEVYMDMGISKIYCGHYPYVKMAFGKEYLLKMQGVAEAIIDGSRAADAKPFGQKTEIGVDNPMILADPEGQAMIVYSPEDIE